MVHIRTFENSNIRTLNQVARQENHLVYMMFHVYGLGETYFQGYQSDSEIILPGSAMVLVFQLVLPFYEILFSSLFGSWFTLSYCFFFKMGFFFSLYETWLTT